MEWRGDGGSTEQRDKNNRAMIGSIASENLDDSKWDMRDPRLDLMGMHTIVLDGWPVWPLVLLQVVMAGDRQAYVDSCLEDADFFTFAA